MAGQPAVSSDLSVETISSAAALHLLRSAKSASWRQFPAYSSFAAEKIAAESRYVAVSGRSGILGVANVRIKRVPFTGIGVAMIAQGPVLLSQDPEAQHTVLTAIRQNIVQQEGLTLRVNPPVDPDPNCSSRAVPRFGEHSARPYDTFLIDIRQDEAALRSNLDGKWRTDLRRGERSELKILRSSDPDQIRLLQPLLSALGTKKGFRSPQDADYFADVAARTKEPENISIHLAYSDDRLIGGHIGAYSGDMAVYLLGATNAEGRKKRASFLVQWAAIQYAQTRGMSWYDLGGVDEEANPDVFRFKKRMGGQRYQGPGMIEAKAAWPKGQILSIAERLYA